MTDHNLDTKNKIMEKARVLFANQGFEGTSIREIAKAADVNVASVNYHFTNKENLLVEILRMGRMQCSEEIGAFCSKENPTLEDLVSHILKYFTQQSHDLKSFFKILMSSQHCHHVTEDEDKYNPPGSNYIAQLIIKEVGPSLTEADINWAVRTLFGHVIHSSIIFDCVFKNASVPFCTYSEIEEGARRLARVVLMDLKSRRSTSNP